MAHRIYDLVEQCRSRLVEKLGDKIHDLVVENDKIFVLIDSKDLPDVTEFVYWELGGYLVSVAGSDERRYNGSYGVYYIFSIEEGLAEQARKPWVVVYAYIPQYEPVFPSITPRVPAASWYEREVMDLLGLKAEGHPDPRRLVLPDDWPEGVHPLREDYRHDFRPPHQTTSREYTFRPDRIEGERIISVPIGPVHPVADEPAQFRLFVDGERIVDVDYRMFYVHRGVEKVAVSRMTYDQIPFIAERICGICGYVHACCYAQAIEDVFKIDVPDRARYIRTILLEIERIHSHLLHLGLLCHMAAFDWGFMQLFKLREKIMDLAEILTGNRKTYGATVIGGVRRDIIKDRINKAMDIIKKTRQEFKEYMDTIFSSAPFMKRITNVGVLEKKVARTLSVVGPVARGSGLPRDVRKDHPYAAYNELTFKVPVYSEGDVLARTMVRVEEIHESLNILEEALDKLPGGSIALENIEPIEMVKGLSAVEAPRGEDSHFVIIGKAGRLLRWKVRAPTYNNWPAIPPMSRDYLVADFPVIAISIDPCYSCTERVLVVDVRDNSKRILSFNYLVNKFRKRMR